MALRKTTQNSLLWSRGVVGGERPCLFLTSCYIPPAPRRVPLQPQWLLAVLSIQPAHLPRGLDSVVPERHVHSSYRGSFHSLLSERLPHSHKLKEVPMPSITDPHGPLLKHCLIHSYSTAWAPSPWLDWSSLRVGLCVRLSQRNS